MASGSRRLPCRGFLLERSRNPDFCRLHCPLGDDPSEEQRSGRGGDDDEGQEGVERLYGVAHDVDVRAEVDGARVRLAVRVGVPFADPDAAVTEMSVTGKGPGVVGVAVERSSCPCGEGAGVTSNGY